MPRSSALWMTLREASRSMRMPKLLQPMPTAETRRPEPPRLRISMGNFREEDEGAVIVTCQPTGCKLRIYPSDLPSRRRRLGSYAERYPEKRCGPGQTRRLTGTAGAHDL